MPVRRRRDRDRPEFDLGVERTPRDPDPVDPLAPGWLSETVSDIATFGHPIDDAEFERADLEAAPFEQQLVGELPTPEMVLGDEDVQARIRGVQDLFGQPAPADDGGEFFEFGFAFDEPADDAGAGEGFAAFDVGLDFGDDEGGGFF